MQTVKRKRGNPGLKGRLVERSLDAFVLSLETINSLSTKYRVESFAYLACNAWELLLKAKILEVTGNRRAIYYKQKPNERPRTLALRDCLRQVFPNEQDPVRRNINRVADLRDEAVHLIISQVPRDVMGLFQAAVLNYHDRLRKWFGISLSDRVPVGMMSIVYDFAPEQVDLLNPVLRRRMGKETVDYLAEFQAEIRHEFETLGKPSEFTIPIEYKLALVKSTDESDIVLTKGDSGLATRVVEVPKCPCKTHPYREKELTHELASRLGDAVPINFYDVRAVVKDYEIKKRPNFFYQGTVKGSPPQYSGAFLSWMVQQLEKDSLFFEKTRRNAKRVLVEPASRGQR